MNDAKLAELREKYKDRNLLEELGWGTYADHSGYTSKQNGEFLNWLCNAAYRAIKEDKPSGKWIDNHNGTFTCNKCSCKHSKSNYCPNCGSRNVVEKQGDNNG